MSAPKLAVLGHPNKGKSSLVASLAEDDSVKVGPDPGTTTVCRSFPLSVDGEVLYTLVDTPGFQRARSALHWMRQHETDAAGHAQVVENFVRSAETKAPFPDECELLTPLVEGAGVIYVVDGSVPYGTEYEAEMEILRWSGRPSMALINLIGEAEYVEQWRSALSQYFSVVRVFDARKADFAKRIELLAAFAQLREEWFEPLSRAVVALKRDRMRKVREASRASAESLVEMLTFKVEQRLGPDETPEGHKPELGARYRARLVRQEKELRSQIESIYVQRRIRRLESELKALEERELFSEETWRLFGLSKREILIFGGISGGLAGGALDVVTAGSTLLLGTLVGGGLGAMMAVFAARSVADFKVLHFPLGYRALVVGPMQNMNFPHIVFNRARLHHLLVANRTHAERSDLLLAEDPSTVLAPLSDGDRRELEKSFQAIRNGDLLTAGERLFEIIFTIFKGDAAASD